MTLVLIAVGGAAGAISRYLIAGWVQELIPGRFPWGTFLVNISGSFLLGLVFVLAIEHEIMAPEIRVPLMVGFIGAYTTFSTFMLDSWALADEGALLAALANIVVSVVVGMVAVIAGLVLGRALT